MYKSRRIQPTCPKCKHHNTYDIIPEIPNIPHIQLSKDVFEQSHEKTFGNAKYYCIDCNYSWKKYRVKKLYEKIRGIHATARGFPGPFFEVEIDFESLSVETKSTGEYEYINMDCTNTRTEEEFEWFGSELFKCDFVN